MTETHSTTQGQLEYLTDQIELLQEKVVLLSSRVDELECGKSAALEKTDVESAAPPSQNQQVQQEGVLKKAGTSSLLPRIATICFVLVLALILRTITDNEMINTRLGSLLGMGYSAALIITGWWLYRLQSSLAPVFPACGLLLLFAVVMETHERFESLSTVMAYTLLFAGGAAVIIMSIRYRASLQLCLAALGSGLVGMSIDFPYPHYSMLGFLLFGGCLAAYLAWRKSICPSLRWTTLGLATLFWTFWSFKLSSPVTACDEPTADLLFLTWFFPFLFLFVAFYVATNIHRIATTDLDELGFFESLVPSFVGVGAFLAAWPVVMTWYDSNLWLGLIGIGAGVGHIVAAAWFASRNREGAIGSTAYIFAGVLLVGLGTAAAFADLLWMIPVFSVSAYLMARISDRWQSGGIRCTSYLFQLAAGITAVLIGTVAADIAAPFRGAFVIATLMCMSFLQYRWCRSHVPPAVNSAFFSWLDKKDFSAVILLLTGLASGFFLLRLGLYQVLVRTSSDFEFMFRGGQTVFINLGAVMLLLFASSRRNREILAVAIIVGLMGMLKSFVFDLFGIKGMPLVFSVFSSGIVAAVGSVISTRWQGRKEKESPEGIAAAQEG